MQEEVTKYIWGYVMYCTSKPTNRKMVFYQPLMFPNHPWESISMDFVGEFPLTKKGHDYLLIMVNYFIKTCILIPYKNTIMG